MKKRIMQWLDNFYSYVIVDAEDNSITLSKRLVKRMNVMGCGEAKVFVFRISGSQDYGFMLNPNIEQETQLADVQFNGKYRTIGFESLCPTVNKILYDYGLPPAKYKLSVKTKHTCEGKTYFKICKPNGKRT